MMESVARSSWGNAEMVGYVKWTKDEGETKYFAFISDASNHGMFKEQAELNINRGTVVANITKETCDSSPCTAAPNAPTDTGALKCVGKY